MAGRKLPALPSLGGKPANDDKIYIVDVSDTSESPEGTSKQVDYEDLEIPVSGNTTITPVITAGTGSCTDVFIYFYRIGSQVHFDFFARTFVIANGESFTAFTIDLTGTGFEPDSNFASAQDVFALGRTSVVTDSSGNALESVAIGTVVGTKTFLISAGLTAVSVGDFSASISGSGSYSI
jgi:hypothetical protein